MILIKVHKSYRNVVAVVDLNLIGKKFESGNKQLDIRESFYKGAEYSEEEAIKILKSQLIEDATFNIVGKESVDICIKAGIISKDSMGHIDKIPFALKLL